MTIETIDTIEPPEVKYVDTTVIACDGDEGALRGTIDAGWEDHVIWNTDYPHPDAPDPDKAVDALLSQPISDDAKRKILWDNPVRLHGPRIL